MPFHLSGSSVTLVGRCTRVDSFETDNPFGVDGSFKAVSFLSV